MSQPALLPYDPFSILTAAAIFLCCLFPSHIRSKMASGVKVTDKVKDLFNEMKVVKNDDDQNERIRVVVFDILNDHIDVEAIHREKDLEGQDIYKFFTSLMQPEKCRYFLYDCHFESGESGRKEELVFLTWCPDSGKIKDKMKYSSSKKAIASVFEGIKHSLHINDFEDISTRDGFAELLSKEMVSLEGHCLKMQHAKKM